MLIDGEGKEARELDVGSADESSTGRERAEA